MVDVSASSNTAGAFAAAMAADQSSAAPQADGSLVVTSPGGDVVATHSDPLPATPVTVAALPTVVEVTVVVPQAVAAQAASQEPKIWSSDIQSAGAWTAQKVETGRAIIDLDSEYRLSINDVLAEVILENRMTNVTTRIWGNAQVEVAGQNIGQFWGTSSFQLANGTLITASTVVSPTNSSAYMLDKLVVTRGENGLVVTGISSDTLGDLQIAQAANVAVFDRVVAPGDAKTTPLDVQHSPEMSDASAQISADALAMTVDTPSVVIKIDVAPGTADTGTPTDKSDQIAIVANVTASVESVKDAPSRVEAVIAGTSVAAPEHPATSILVENLAPAINAALANINGYGMDSRERDGLVFVEKEKSWVDEWDGQQISAAVLDQTRPGESFGPDSTIMSRGEFDTVIRRFVSMMSTQSMANQMASRNGLFQSHMRDLASDFDKQAEACHASDRAARDRRALLNMIEVRNVDAGAPRFPHLDLN